MILESRAAAPFFKNGYVLACENTLEGVVIDPGHEIEDLLAIVSKRHLAIRHILLTHGHVDHVSGVARAREVLGAHVYLHPLELPVYAAAVQQGLYFGLAIEQPPPADRYYDASPIVFGHYQARAHHTPGHSPGGVCLEVGRTGEPGVRLFSGDTLFNGSIGRTDLPGGDYHTLIRSITEVLIGFPDGMEVHPGHGPATTIGDERRTNPFLPDAA